jgi:hypothetical protein
MFEQVLDITFRGPIPQSRDELKSLLVAKLNDCQKQVSLMYHSSQQGAEDSTISADLAIMSTPKASFNAFHPLLNHPLPTFHAFNTPGNSSTAPLPWLQMYEATNANYHQLQYPQESQNPQIESMDLHHSQSRDSGYGTISVGCFLNCSGFCTCYDSSDMNRSSFDGSAQTTSYLDGLGLAQGRREEAMDSGQMQSNMLTSIPRSNGNVDDLDHFL